MIKVVICDIDGTLMNPSAGLYVSKEIKNKLIQLQESGVLVILNSARTIQGIQPLSKQIMMDRYGGYLIACNGTSVIDAKTKRTLFEYSISSDTCLQVWGLAKGYQLVPGFVQPKHAVVQEMTNGYVLDHYNCQVDYIVTEKPHNYIYDPIWKMTVSGTKEQLDQTFEKFKGNVESHYDLTVIRSTDEYCDIVLNKVSKYKTCQRLLNDIRISWKDVSCIGDGKADMECIEASNLGVSLENASESIQSISDMIVPSCYEEGALVWIDYLMKHNKGSNI